MTDYGLLRFFKLIFVSYCPCHSRIKLCKRQRDGKVRSSNFALRKLVFSIMQVKLNIGIAKYERDVEFGLLDPEE